VDAWGVDADARHRAIVERNVLLQLENLRTFDTVRQALQADELLLHGWVYDLSSGRVSYWDASVDRFVDEGET
jgi:carbonic anhydrase